MKSGGTQSAFAQSANTIIDTWIGSRKKVSLWLDLKITHEVETLEIIQYMKDKRQFRKSVMTGLKIIWELRQGRVDTLLAEFPNIRDLLQVKPPTDDDGAGRLERMENMMEILVAGQKTGGYTMQSSQPASVPALPKAEAKQAAAMSADDLADNFLNFFQ